MFTMAQQLIKENKNKFAEKCLKEREKVAHFRNIIRYIRDHMEDYISIHPDITIVDTDNNMLSVVTEAWDQLLPELLSEYGKVSHTRTVQYGSILGSNRMHFETFVMLAVDPSLPKYESFKDKLDLYKLDKNT